MVRLRYVVTALGLALHTRATGIVYNNHISGASNQVIPSAFVVHPHLTRCFPPNFHQILPTYDNRFSIFFPTQQHSDSYDFVICGGGLAGLVIASRLTEDTNHTVLVLEAGASGDAVKSSIDVPSNAYYSSLIGTSYDWQFVTTAQDGLGGRKTPWPRGKVVGGSTAVNGMYLVRPSQLEMDAWKTMLGNMSGADIWGWDSMFAYMKKVRKGAWG